MRNKIVENSLFLEESIPDNPDRKYKNISKAEIYMSGYQLKFKSSIYERICIQKFGNLKILDLELIPKKEP